MINEGNGPQEPARFSKMANPWLKKNPLMSMWLSGANAIAGTARGKVVARAQRQTATAMTQAAQAMIDAWSGHPPSRAPKHRKKAKRG